MKATLDQYEQLLRDLLQEVPASAAKRIRSILNVCIRPSIVFDHI